MLPVTFSKNTRLEYLPSEDGEKVEPEIDPALIAKSGKETEKKETQLQVKKESKELNMVDIITNSVEEARTQNFYFKFKLIYYYTRIRKIQFFIYIYIYIEFV